MNDKTASIRVLEEADLELVLSWRNYPSIRNMMFSAEEISPCEHWTWFHRVTIEKTHHLLILEINSEPSGFIQFSNIDLEGNSDWGFYTSPESPKGSGKLLGVTALDHAFYSLRINSISGETIKENAPSIKLHKYLGFTQIKPLFSHDFTRVEVESTVRFKLMKSEWNETRELL